MKGNGLIFLKFYVDIGKAVWIFEVSSNVEADSTERLDGVRNMHHYGMNLLPGICFVIWWTRVSCH